jgi:hypothetical protein
MFTPRPAIVAIMSVATLCVAPRASTAGDYEYWAKAAFTVPITEAWRFTFEERLSFGDEARRLDDY